MKHDQENLEWKPVIGFHGYEVSTDGSVRTWRTTRQGRRFEPKVLTSRVGVKGYIRVTFCVDNKEKIKYVAHLVSAAFLGPRPAGLYVCHNDGDKTNNRLENLRYDTPKSNQADRIAHGTTNRGENNGQSKITANDASEVLRFVSDGWSQRFIARLFGVSQSQISNIARGKKWRYVLTNQVERRVQA